MPMIYRSALAFLFAVSSPAALAQTPSDSHLEAAYELLVISQAEDQYEQAQEIMLTAMISG